MSPRTAKLGLYFDLLPDKDAPPAGYEIVPTAQAKSLVAYLLSLKKGYHLKPDEAGIPYVPPGLTSHDRLVAGIRNEVMQTSAGPVAATVTHVAVEPEGRSGLARCLATRPGRTSPGAAGQPLR